MSVWQFIQTRLFLKHLIIILVVTIVLIWSVLRILDLFTRHGESYVVPDLKNLTIAEIEANKYDGDFEYVVIDSIFKM
jgi:hypothetical protein